MSATASAIMDEKYALQIGQLKKMLREAQLECRAKEKKWAEAHTTKRRGTPDRIWFKKLQRLTQKFNNWRSGLCVVGFNSGNYDLPLIRDYLYPLLVEIAGQEYRKRNGAKSFDERMAQYLKLNIKTVEDCDDTDDSDGEETDEENEEEVDPLDIPEDKAMDFGDIPILIKQGTGILCLTTKTLKFLDMSRYLGAGTSLDKFLKHWEKHDSILLEKGEPVPFGVLKGTKIPFPYGFLDSLDKLEYRGVPPKSAFQNHLRREQITQTEYVSIVKLYAEKGFQTFRDYLHYYIMLDTLPFLQAINKTFKMMFELTGIDMFTEALSLPGMTLKFLHRNSMDFNYSLFDNEDLYNDLRGGLTGGLAVVNNRYAKVGESVIRGNPKNIVQEIMGLDFNALYLAALGRDMPTGFYDHWKLVEDGAYGPYMKRGKTNKPEASNWLDYIRLTEGLELVYAQRNGYEKRCGPRQLPVDGLDMERKIVYEFNGCFWHNHDLSACLCKNRTANIMNPRTKRTVEQCSLELEDRKAYLESLGFSVVIKWECEWLAEKKTSNVQNVLESLNTKGFANKFCVSHKNMLKGIEEAKVFGFVKCDIFTPDHLKDFFKDFPPVIKKAEISIDDIGDYMKQWSEENGEMSRPRKALIGSYFGEKVWLLTPVLKYLLEKGLLVTKIHDVIQYEPKATFGWFRDLVTEKRREGDENPECKMIGDLMKLYGNSGYGKTITALHKHKNVGLIGEEYVRSAIKDPFFEHVDPLGDAFEITMRPRRKKMGLPIQIGLAVYQYAKLYMMEFAWDLLGKYADPALYDWLESDTDSIYLMLARESFDDIILPDKLDEYNAIKHKYFVIDEKKDLRTPGLLKVEYKGGEVMVCLRAKMYAIQGKEENKLSCSGLMKRTNDIGIDEYRKVIETGEIGTGINVGFMKRNNKINTYVQERAGMTNLYIKRKVLNDRVSTLPLDI